jgi:pimeloyl-ACP methyl ester carboxylesterase
MPRFLWIAIVMAIAGCGVEPVNPSFPVSIAGAKEILTEDAAHPVPLKRPLLIVGGFMDPGVAPLVLCSQYRAWTGDPRIIGVQLGWVSSFDQCRRDIISAVDRAFPCDEPGVTTEVDVIGVSMGGLAARYAAAEETSAGVRPARRLRIGRLFTISSPHRGALLADDIPINLHPVQADMRENSPMIHWLNTRPIDPAEVYPIYCYTRLNDLYVGTRNAAPPGETAWWVAPPPLVTPHGGAFRDARILADIAARLRGEPPLTHEPPSPIPTDAEAKTCTR